MIKEEVKLVVQQAVKALNDQGKLVDIDKNTCKIEPANKQFDADWAINHAMVLASCNSMAPMKIGDMLQEELANHEFFKKVELVKPGFINLTLSDSRINCEIKSILIDKDTYAAKLLKNSDKTLIEFVSANPTGPLHIGHARSAAIGDSIAQILSFCGWDVTTEYYYNDAGKQIDNLTNSVLARMKGISPGDSAWPDDGYCGDYIHELAEICLSNLRSGMDIKVSNPDTYQVVRKSSVANLRDQQKQELQVFGVQFDNYFSESSLFDDGSVIDVINLLKKTDTLTNQKVPCG